MFVHGKMADLEILNPLDSGIKPFRVSLLYVFIIEIDRKN